MILTDPITPTREVLWNISHSWVIYPMFAVSLAVAAWGVWRRVRTWRQGSTADRFDRPKERLQLLLKHALGQRRTLRERHARFFHAAIFFGFIVLTIATTVVMIHHDFGLPLMQG
ncbi:MAG: (Fe-S)-binding protein, partial [Acidobacteria bacterium]|nr:(Fe-S)-binding protein [Acidobacteriota bacterium]